MGIDGIGKPPGGGIPPVGGSGEGPRVGGPSKPFEVDKVAGAEGAVASDPLSRLERGEIDVDQYLDTRVAEAVTHLSGQLSPEQLEFVKGTLREQLRTDPVLVELVRRTTGAAPTEPG